MAESLYELLALNFATTSPELPIPTQDDNTTSKYLNRLSTLKVGSLDSTEPQSLAQAAHTNLLSLQALSTRSSKSIIKSAEHLKSLEASLPELVSDVSTLQSKISTLDKSAVGFAEKYSRAGENEILDRRKKALLMSRNVDRLSDVLDLPTLLASAISTSASQSATSNTTYATALDLHSHINRLHQLYPDSALLESIHDQAEGSMKEMKSNLITSLRAQNIKLAAGMRTVGWLRRIAPDLDTRSSRNGHNISEGNFGALFLVCRLANLLSMLEALEPLRGLADQEFEKRLLNTEQLTSGNAWSGGQQTERYLKRYIEIFREQSFAIISMFKSIFPSDENTGKEDLGLQFQSLGLKSPMPIITTFDKDDRLHPLPSALATFPSYLVDLLTETLKQYLPNVRDKSSRESLLTQVLYCAGSLGRLGGDFSMIIALLDEDQHDDEKHDGVYDEGIMMEWVVVMKKHKALAGRLESLAGGTTSSMGKGTLKSTQLAAKT